MVVTANTWVQCIRLIAYVFVYSAFLTQGGSASIFHGWGAQLLTAIEVCPVQLPGRPDRFREAPLPSSRRCFRRSPRPFAPILNVPFALFGHSLGALVSFELARLWRRQEGFHPIHLFVSARRAPQMTDLDPLAPDLPHDRFLNELRRLNGTPQEVSANPHLLQLVLPALRADLTICRSYTYVAEAPLKCRISAFGGRQDRAVSPAQIADWQCQTDGSFRSHLFDGDRFFLDTVRASLRKAIADLPLELVL